MTTLIVRTRSRYFGAFADSVLVAFYKSFNSKLLEVVLGRCKNAQLFPDSTSGRTLAELPPSLVYLMLSELDYLRNSKVMGIIYSHVPDKPITGWPTEAPPAGVLMLLMERSSEVRAWATSQVALCTRRPMNSDQFLPVYGDTLRLCTNAITSPGSGSESDLFSGELLELWNGYSVILRYVPQDWLYSSRDRPLDIRQVVIGHLSDTGPREYGHEPYDCMEN